MTETKTAALANLFPIEALYYSTCLTTYLEDFTPATPPPPGKLLTGLPIAFAMHLCYSLVKSSTDITAETTPPRFKYRSYNHGAASAEFAPIFVQERTFSEVAMDRMRHVAFRGCFVL